MTINTGLSCGDIQIPVIRDWLMMNCLKGIYHNGSYDVALRLSDEYKVRCQYTAIKERITRDGHGFYPA